MSPFPNTRRRQSGLSLIELMVAVVIGTVLMLGVIQVFIASRTASRLAEGVARTQENARFAIDFLERDIRMAGHYGCVNDQAHFIKDEGDPRHQFTAASGAGSPLDFSVAVQGYEAGGTAPGDTLTLGEAWSDAGNLPSEIVGLNPLGGSDVLVLRFLAGEGVPVTAITADSGGSELTVDTERAARLSQGTPAAPTMFGIADCAHVDIFPGSVAGGTVTATNADLSRYAPPNGQTLVYRAESIVYYIGAGASGEPALRRARANAAGAYPAELNEELVEGIENLQVLFGLDSTPDISVDASPIGNITVQATASGVSTGTDAAAAGQWRRVGLVQVGVLARSPQPADALQAQQKVARQGALGVEFAPSDTRDTRYRASYEVSVALRNRLYGN